MAHGIVSWFNVRRGTGVIIEDDTGVEVPVAATDIDGGGRQSLAEGDRVVFTVSALDLSGGRTSAVATTVYVP